MTTRLNPRHALSGALLGTFCAISLSAGAAELTRAELLARVVGNTIHYSADNDDIYEFLAPDGTIRGSSRVHGTYTAHWRILENDAMCFEHADPMASGCVAVVLRTDQIEYHRKDGVVEGPFPLLKGNPQAL